MKLIFQRKFILAFLFLLLSSVISQAQTGGKTAPGAARPAEQAIRSTPAYAEILLRRTELESILEDLSGSYTEDYPKVKEARYELDLIEKDGARLLTFGVADLPRMTLALGKLLVRRAELQTALWSLKARFNDQHPDVVRAKRRVSTFDKAIAEILP